MLRILGTVVITLMGGVAWAADNTAPGTGISSFSGSQNEKPLPLFPQWEAKEAKVENLTADKTAVIAKGAPEQPAHSKDKDQQDAKQHKEHEKSEHDTKHHKDEASEHHTKHHKKHKNKAHKHGKHHDEHDKASEKSEHSTKHHKEHDKAAHTSDHEKKEHDKALKKESHKEESHKEDFKSKSKAKKHSLNDPKNGDQENLAPDAASVKQPVEKKSEQQAAIQSVDSSEPVAPIPQQAKADLQVLEFVLTNQIVNKEPREIADKFSASEGRGFAFARLNVPANTEVTFVWSRNDHEYMRLTMPVHQARKWRTHSSIKLRPGDWKVQLLGQNKDVIAEKSFVVVE